MLYTEPIPLSGFFLKKKPPPPEQVRAYELENRSSAGSGYDSSGSTQIQSARPSDDRELYKKRNEAERLFRRLKGFRRSFSRFEKLDVVFLVFIAFINFALLVDALR